MTARATVIVPTFGNAKFARWAIKSVQQQSVENIEICIICDGSPENMIAFFKSMGKEDPRIKIFIFPKSPRTGEPYRDIVIKQTTGEIICYCSHDDLWLPCHIEEMEKSLKNSQFTHSLHAIVNLPEQIIDENTLLGYIYCIDLRNSRIINRMLGGENFFGLTFGAHTRKGYFQLEKGWETTPRKGIPTDLYMWCKFLSAYRNHCKTTLKITALNFQQTTRKEWSEQERDEELKQYFEKLRDPAILKKIEQSCLFKFVEKEALIQSLTTRTTDKEMVIQTLTSQIAEKDQMMQALASQMAVKEHAEQVFKSQLAEKDQMFQTLTAQLTEIKSSTAWGVIQLLWRVRVALAPHESKRERTVHLIMKGLRIFRTEGFYSFLHKTFSKLNRF